MEKVGKDWLCRKNSKEQRYPNTTFVKMAAPRYSVVIPVYNRPQEVHELLESLTRQTFTNFEVIIVEDGSTVTSRHVFEAFANRLTIQYCFKPNSGPGPSRNFGFEQARGEYLVVFDSDCVVPDHYFEAVERYLKNHPVDAWGGPDRGREDFTVLQQAMGYTMASVLTTGGIRGGKAKGFQPRSFNMGIHKTVFEKTGGFKFDRLAEDIELSVRMRKLGFQIALIEGAFVYHKRRTTFEQFFHQVSNFGRGRVRVGRVHPGEIKPTHWFPAFFLLGLFALPVLLIFSGWMFRLLFLVYSLYLLLIFIDGIRTTRSLLVALLCVPAALIQLTGYGSGFLREIFGNRG